MPFRENVSPPVPPGRDVDRARPQEWAFAETETPRLITENYVFVIGLWNSGHVAVGWLGLLLVQGMVLGKAVGSLGRENKAAEDHRPSWEEVGWKVQGQMLLNSGE